MSDPLQTDLRAADPVSGDDPARLRDLVRSMAVDARDAATVEPHVSTPWWRRHRTIIPLGVVGVVALTGAAVLIPLSLGINGVRVDLDAEIPIVYTTDTGVEISCRYGIYIGDPSGRTAADEELAEFFQDHDWSGIGQRIYDEAIANPFVPGPDDDWEVDSQDLRDKFSFNNAVDLIWDEVPNDLLASTQSSGAVSDCTGQLH